MRDNEKIIQVIQCSKVFIKDQLMELLKADASPDTIRSFVECLTSFECAANNMGERRSDGSSAVYGVISSGSALVEHRP